MQSVGHLAQSSGLNQGQVGRQDQPPVRLLGGFYATSNAVGHAGVWQMLCVFWRHHMPRQAAGLNGMEHMFSHGFAEQQGVEFVLRATRRFEALGAKSNKSLIDSAIEIEVSPDLKDI